MNGDPPSLPIKVYQRVPDSASIDPGAPGALIAKFHVFLPDRPGSLASLASAIAGANGNISFFHYDRSLDSSRIAAEVQLADRAALSSLVSAFREKRFGDCLGSRLRDDVQITSTENVLELKVRLENRPGALAAFAQLLADHHANVLYMLYDEDIDPGSANIALATTDPAEISTLLQAANEQGYQYRVLYRGADEQEMARVIGLTMVEKFFLRLKHLLPASDLDELRSLVASSQELEQDLVRFYAEAGNHLEAGDIFEQVLTLASRSRSRTGDRFTAVEMEPLHFPGGVDLLGFRLPTSESIYVFRQGKELTMIDAGHGIYYHDLKDLLRSRGLDPSQVRRIFVTHPDTDHAGSSGYFEEEFGTVVHLHPGSSDVIASGNRAYGASGGLLKLNEYYTRLSSRFTECRFPSRPRFFSTTELGRTGPFRIIDRFSIGPLVFDALESRGGHTPGLVFFLDRGQGLIFTSDYLIDLPSLLPEEKEHLGLYRSLLTSPNRDHALYKEETDSLKELLRELDRTLQAGGKQATVFPGHGGCYPAGSLAR